jgi:o-succinylbenzoate synthase
MGFDVEFYPLVNQTLNIYKKRMNFLFKAKTSRNTFSFRDIFVLELIDGSNKAYGEAAPLSLLSVDDVPNYQDRLIQFAKSYHDNALDWSVLNDFPSIRFGLETLDKCKVKGGFDRCFDQKFSAGESIKINGLIWMDSPENMLKSAKQKVQDGFSCIKLKIGAHPFHQELELLKMLRSSYPKDILEIRVDANGAFDPGYALNNLESLSKLQIHSIEQPIARGQWEEMGKLCAQSAVPIALDEELIGVNVEKDGAKLLDAIKPQYIILKPNLLGGFKKSDQWIELAEERNIAWWATSALESNIGLNAISQWCSSKKVQLPQGLGTGSLYSNNVGSPLKVEGEFLSYNHQSKWDIESFLRDAEKICQYG